MTVPGPGWYDQGDGRRRWWDGTAWTEHIEAPLPSPRRGRSLPWWGIVLIVVGSIVVVVGVPVGIGAIAIAGMTRTEQVEVPATLPAVDPLPELDRSPTDGETAWALEYADLPGAPGADQIIALAHDVCAVAEQEAPIHASEVLWWSVQQVARFSPDDWAAADLAGKHDLVLEFGFFGEAATTEFCDERYQSWWSGVDELLHHVEFIDPVE